MRSVVVQTVEHRPEIPGEREGVEHRGPPGFADLATPRLVVEQVATAPATSSVCTKCSPGTSGSNPVEGSVTTAAPFVIASIILAHSK